MMLSNKNYLVNIVSIIFLYIKYSSLWCIILNSGTSSCFYACGTHTTYNPFGTNINGECIGDKVIYSDSLCTFHPYSTSNRLGDYIYSGTPSYSTCSSYICKCDYFFDIFICYGKKNYNCYSQNSFTYKYCNYETKECYNNNCPYEFTIMKYNGIYSGVTRCSDTCLTNEWRITIPNNDNTVREYCVDSCYNPTSTIYSSYQYEYIYNGVRKCLKVCINEYYIKEYSSGKYACVPREECNYYSNSDHKCYSTCPTSKKYHNFGSFECIAGCTEGEYLYENNSICYRKTDCNFVDEHTSTFKCLNSSSRCDHSSTYKYHDYNSKLCIEKCGKNNEKYIFIANEGNICYSSCAEIPGYYRYEGIDESEVTVKTCYQTKPTLKCEVYYQKADGVFKCTTQKECINTLKYSYFLGDECKFECNDFYKLYYFSLTDGGKRLNYTKCFTTLNDTLNYNSSVKFCDTFLKKCYFNFPKEDHYKIKSSFYYPYNNRYEIVKVCPYFYDNRTGETDPSLNQLWCVDDCYPLGKYFLRGYKKCLVSCEEVKKYSYYDPTNNECLDSCELRYENPFVYPITTTPQPCHSECVSGKGLYYSYNSHLCQEKCNEDRTDNLYYPLGEYICYASCRDIPGDYLYRYEFRNNSCTPTKHTIPSDDCELFYIKPNGLARCAIPKDCRDLDYLYLLEYECKKNVTIIIIN